MEDFKQHTCVWDDGQSRVARKTLGQHRRAQFLFKQTQDTDRILKRNRPFKKGLKYKKGQHQ